MRIKLFPGQRYDVDAAAPLSNTANVRSRILRWQVPQNRQFVIVGGFEPKIKLYAAGPTEIGVDSLITLAARKAGAANEVPVDEFAYLPYAQLTATEQRNSLNTSSIRQDLGMPSLTVKEGNFLEIYLQASSVVDLSLAGTTFELEVDERAA